MLAIIVTAIIFTILGFIIGCITGIYHQKTYARTQSNDNNVNIRHITNGFYKKITMINIQPNQILKYKNNNNTDTVKVRAVLGDNALLSESSPEDTTHGHRNANRWFSFERIEEIFELQKEKWVPEEREHYFYANLYSDSKYVETYYVQYDVDDEQRIKIGNCFRTKEEAIAMREKMLQVLEGNE